MNNKITGYINRIDYSEKIGFRFYGDGVYEEEYQAEDTSEICIEKYIKNCQEQLELADRYLKTVLKKYDLNQLRLCRSTQEVEEWFKENYVEDFQEKRDLLNKALYVSEEYANAHVILTEEEKYLDDLKIFLHEVNQ